MRTALFTILSFLLSISTAFADSINVCSVDGIIPTEQVVIGPTGLIQFNKSQSHVADAKINFKNTNIYQRNGVLYLTNISTSDSSIAIVNKNGAWILFQDNGDFPPVKEDPLAVAIFHNKDGVAIGELETYAPMMEHNGSWKIDGHRGSVEDVDLYTSVGLLYINEHDNLVVTRDDTSDQLEIDYTPDGFTIKLIRN